LEGKFSLFLFSLDSESLQIISLLPLEIGNSLMDWSLASQALCFDVWLEAAFLHLFQLKVALNLFSVFSALVNFSN